MQTALRYSIAALLLSALTAPMAIAGKDRLDLPAQVSAKAARAMMLGVAAAGSRLVAVGEHGIVVYSDDQGGTWRQGAVPTSTTLTAVHFPDPKNGWAVGHDGIVLATTDGGRTWNKRFDGNQGNALIVAEAEQAVAAAKRADEAAAGAKKAVTAKMLASAEDALGNIQAEIKFGPSRPLLGLWFKNARQGYVVGAYGQLFRTADAGRQWDFLGTRLDNPDELHLNAIAATPGGVLLIAGEGGKLYRSRDGGIQWQTLDTGYTGHLYGALGLPDGEGRETLLAFGFGGHVFVADEDGLSWHELPNVLSKNLIAATGTADRLLLLAQDGSMLASRDRARSFTRVGGGAGLPIASAALLEDGARVALAGVGGVRIVSVDQTAKVNHP